MRDTQVSSPASFVNSMAHTWVLRPMCHRHAAMQQAVGLARAIVHRHTGADEVVGDLQEFNAQVRYRAVGVVKGEQFDGNRSFPGRHRGFQSFKSPGSTDYKEIAAYKG